MWFRDWRPWRDVCYSSTMDKPRWGGRREGAGRPRTRPHPGLTGPGVPHLARVEIDPRHPVHVTLLVQPGIGPLRGQRAKLLEDAVREARIRLGMRILHHAMQGSELHLLVEVDSADSLSRGMQGLTIRIAKGLNALAGRKGGVFVDRYQARALNTRREVANAVRHILGNRRKR